MEWREKHYFISTDKSLLEVDRIHAFLSNKAYWCLSIPKTVILSAINNSLCFGVFDNHDGNLLQIGFARIVTDKATFAWLCDVYVEETYREQGLATWLMKCVMNHPELQNLRRICLATKDAHGLYQKFGFEVTTTPGNWMEIKDNDLYKKKAAKQEISSAISDAIAYGIDVSMIESNLQISPQERLERHESAFELAKELRQAGEQLSKT